MDRTVGGFGAHEDPFPKVFVSFLAGLQSISEALARFGNLLISDFGGGLQESFGVFSQCVCVVAQCVGSFEMTRSILSFHKMSFGAGASQTLRPPMTRTNSTTMATTRRIWMNPPIV
jgi:hypothetical protein